MFLSMIKYSNYWKLNCQRYYEVELLITKNNYFCVENILSMCHTHTEAVAAMNTSFSRCATHQRSYELPVCPARLVARLWAGKNTTNTLRPFVYELKSSLGFWSLSASLGVTGLTEGFKYVWRRPEAPRHVSVCVTASLNIHQVKS